MTIGSASALKTLVLAAATLAVSFGPAANPAERRASLRLQVNDAVAAPGGLVAVVIRTHSPRPISQGQISVRTKLEKRGRRQISRGAEHDAVPSLTLENYKVFSQRDDAEVDAQVRAKRASQSVVLEFSSESGSINRSDGPLAVLYFRLAPDAVPGQEYELSIDVNKTSFVNPKGNPIRFAPGRGVLRVRKPNIEREMAFEVDAVTPGETARIELHTFEPVSMSRGHLEIQYEPSIASALPTVTMNRKYGRRDFDVDLSTPGWIIVDFHSKDASWNLVPGGILTIDLPTSLAVEIGTRSPITVDASATELLDGSGTPLEYAFRDGWVTFGRSGTDDGDDSVDDDSSDDADDDNSDDSNSDNSVSDDDSNSDDSVSDDDSSSDDSDDDSSDDADSSDDGD